MNSIKDFIYLDMNKVSSLYSQLVGGIVQSIEASSSNSKNSKNLRNYNFKVITHEAGGTKVESQNVKETRVSHHDIYNELESELLKKGYASEIGVDVLKDDIISGESVIKFENSLCVKAEGFVVLEDYERITRIADNYENVTEFINQSVLSNLKSSPDMQDIFKQVESLKNDIRGMKNGQNKNKKKSDLTKFESELNELISNAQVGKIDDWIIDGLKTWVRVFLPDIFNIRLYPFDDLEDFHVMSNLNREYFLDDNTEFVHYLFGSKPTIKLTMLGVITSIPKKEGNSFNPMKEFDLEDDEDKGNEAKSFEKGFRGVFRGFDGLEEMIRTCRYPRIMVQPIAIYRSITPNKTSQNTSN